MLAYCGNCNVRWSVDSEPVYIQPVNTEIEFLPNLHVYCTTTSLLKLLRTMVLNLNGIVILRLEYLLHNSQFTTWHSWAYTIIQLKKDIKPKANISQNMLPKFVKLRTWFIKTFKLNPTCKVPITTEPTHAFTIFFAKSTLALFVPFLLFG